MCHPAFDLVAAGGILTGSSSLGFTWEFDLIPKSSEKRDSV